MSERVSAVRRKFELSSVGVALATCIGANAILGACSDAGKGSPPTSSTAPAPPARHCTYELPYQWAVLGDIGKNPQDVSLKFDVIAKSLGVSIDALKAGRGGPVYCDTGIPSKEIDTIEGVKIHVDGTPADFHINADNCLLIGAGPTENGLAHHPIAACPAQQAAA